MQKRRFSASFFELFVPRCEGMWIAGGKLAWVSSWEEGYPFSGPEVQ
jgi:Zn-finger nucleic acid-binding protein